LIYDRETLENMIYWALEKGIHVVSDEIYANSTFPDQTMISAADVMHEKNNGQSKYLSDYVHIVAGMSKDFGMSGFRIGWLFSHN
jgi:aspartate/methionine/tyrosine aminotransferase